MSRSVFPIILVLGAIWIVIAFSCANEGMPTGGPRDTIPPVLMETFPEYRSLRYQGSEVRLTFDEFIVPDQVSDLLVISPPLEKRPTILTRSKTLIIRFNEELRKDYTYSMDFKNAIVDNNERNPIENLRFLFSTGDRVDSLRIAGKVVDAFTMEPVKKMLVMVHKNLHDSVIYHHSPDYIAKTDDHGVFVFDNLAEGSYRIYALNDMNSDLKYNEGAEQIAFLDSLIVPSAEYDAEPDTLVTGVDSLLVEGHVRFLPDPIMMHQFTEDIFDQYVKRYRRDSRYQCTFVFNKPVDDSLSFNLVDTVASRWYIIEPNEKFDSLTMWITDTTLAAHNSIKMELAYSVIDSMKNLYLYKDTVDLIFTEKEDDPRRRRRGESEEKEQPETAQFDWLTNIGTGLFDLDQDIIITSPFPIASFNHSDIKVFLSSDSLKRALPVDISIDSLLLRRYIISHSWDGERNYTLEIDSAASVNIYGINSRKLSVPFKTRAVDYYGVINLDLKGGDSQMIIQLVENNEKEKVLREQVINEEGEISFKYLVPGKYRVKVIYDNNGNGRWDPGSFIDNYQPERVAYINEVIKVRGNWDNNLVWDLTYNPLFQKNIVDQDLDVQDRDPAGRNLQRGQPTPSGTERRSIGTGGMKPAR